MSGSNGSGRHWVCLSTSFYDNPKVLKLAHSKQFKALHVYVCSLAWSGKHVTEGDVPAYALPFVSGTRKEANVLVEAGLWLILPDLDGWYINDWDTYQMPITEIETRREKRRQDGRDAANKRWHGE